MAKCTPAHVDFPRVKKRDVQVDFSGAAVSSDGGALLLAAADRRLGLTQAITRVLVDDRRRKSCAHSLGSLVRQRIFGLALGYEDLNDHTTLRRDPLLQTVEHLQAIAGGATGGVTGYQLRFQQPLLG